MANPIKAPLRAAVRIVSAGPRLATRVLDVPLRVSSSVLRELLGKRREPTDSAPAPPAPPSARAPEPAAPASPVEVDDHVEVEVERVASSTDPGAEEGAGPELEIGEPWGGYRAMSVASIVERIAVADAAEIALARLYESANRDRPAIQDAIDARLDQLERDEVSSARI